MSIPVFDAVYCSPHVHLLPILLTLTAQGLRTAAPRTTARLFWTHVPQPSVFTRTIQVFATSPSMTAARPIRFHYGLWCPSASHTYTQVPLDPALLSPEHCFIFVVGNGMCFPDLRWCPLTQRTAWSIFGLAAGHPTRPSLHRQWPATICVGYVCLYVYLVKKCFLVDVAVIQS